MRINLLSIYYGFTTLIYFIFIYFDLVKHFALDDFFMMLISSGLYTGTSEDYLVYQNILTGKFLKSFYLIKDDINWYFCFQYLWNFICSLLALKIILTHNNKVNFIRYLIFLFFIVFWILLNFNFTYIAGYSSIIGFYYFYCTKNKTLITYVISFIFISVGILIRSNISLLILLFGGFLIFLDWCFSNFDKKILNTFAKFFILAFLLFSTYFSINRLYLYQNNEHMDYQIFNAQKLAKIYDTPIEHYEEAYRKIKGFSKLERNYIGSMTRLKKLLDYEYDQIIESKKYQGIFLYIKKGVSNAYIVIVLFLSAIFLLRRDNKVFLKSCILLLGLFVTGILVTAFYLLFKIHVFYTCIIFIVMFILISIKEIKKYSLLLLPAVIFILLYIADYKKVFSSYDDVDCDSNYRDIIYANKIIQEKGYDNKLFYNLSRELFTRFKNYKTPILIKNTYLGVNYQVYGDKLMKKAGLENDDMVFYFLKKDRILLDNLELYYNERFNSELYPVDQIILPSNDTLFLIGIRNKK